MYHQLHDPAFLAVASGGTPALDLFFSATKTLDSRITFTRASTATFVNASGLVESAASGSARFTHDPSTLASLGLLIEESRTNLLLRSEELATFPWATSAVTVSANVATAPDGANTADKIVETAANADHYIYQGVTTGTITATFSVYLKAAERTWAVLNAYDGAQRRVWINLATGALGNADAGVTASVQAMPNGWYRLISTRTATSLGNVSFSIAPTTGNGASSLYLGDGTSGILAWGAQLEAGAFATSYIPTTTASATRAADVATMTGTNFSSWYNQNEGTFSVQAQPLDITTATIFTVDDNGISNRIYVQRETSSSSLRGVVAVSGAAVASLSVVGVPTSINAAFAYKQNDFAFSANGSASTTDTAGNLPAVDRLRLGVAPAAGFGMFGPISRLRYYRRRLPNSMLQALSA